MSRPRFSILLLALSCAWSVSPGAHARDPAFSLTSADLSDGGTLGPRQILDGFGCRGGNQSPQLAWNDPPAGTRSFAVTVYDPDAPTGSGWWHWVVYDLPADARSLPAGAGAGSGQAGLLPAGARQGRSDFGTMAFGGACPPAGDKPHRYVFTVYALKVATLTVPSEPSGAMAGFMIHANALASAQMTATFRR